MIRLALTQKKGVSPLIATVLLMAFAVALGALVMTWGKSYVTEETATIERSEKQLTCSFEVSGEVLRSPQPCFQAGSTRFIFKNGGISSLDGLKITAFGIGGSIHTATFNQEIGKAEILPVIPAYDTPLAGPPTQIIIAPLVTVEGEEIACTDVIDPVTDITTC